MPYNVLIVEDQEMPKQLFEIFVNSSENYVHVASLSDASLAPTVCRTRKVDLVLMDVCTAQNSSGLDAAEQIKKEVPSVKIIIVTSMPEFSWIKRAKEIGVDSFWYKDVNQETILAVMDRTMQGENIYPDNTPCIKLGYTTNHDLTERELQILKAMMSGDSNVQIAERLCISSGTVKRHIENMLVKPGFIPARNSWRKRVASELSYDWRKTISKFAKASVLKRIIIHQRISLITDKAERRICMKKKFLCFIATFLIVISGISLVGCDMGTGTPTIPDYNADIQVVEPENIDVENFIAEEDTTYYTSPGFSLWMEVNGAFMEMDYFSLDGDKRVYDNLYFYVDDYFISLPTTTKICTHRSAIAPIWSTPKKKKNKATIFKLTLKSRYL